MMKKMIAILLAAMMMLGCATAFAATYTDRDRDLTFDYDDTLMEISHEDQTDDELLVILGFKDASWGDGFVRIHLRDLDDGEKFPTQAEVAASLNTEVTQGDWDGFRNVLMYDAVNNDTTLDQVFIVPVYDDDDNEVEDILTVEISVEKTVDEEAAMMRDDQISAVVNTLCVLDD